MAKSLAGELYATLASVTKKPEQVSGSSRENVKKRNHCDQPGNDRNELPFKKNVKSLKGETDLDQSGNSTQIPDEQKCQSFSKKKGSISIHEHNLPPTQDQTSQMVDMSKLEQFHRKEKIIHKSTEYHLPHTSDQTSNENKRLQVKDRKQILNSGFSTSDGEWQRVHKYKHGKNQKQQPQNLSKPEYQKCEIGSPNTSCKAGESFQPQVRQHRLHAKVQDQSKGGHGSHTQTEKHNFSMHTKHEMGEGMSGQEVEGKCFLGYRQLEKLANGEPPEIIVVLASRRSEFETLLKKQLRPDFLILIIRVLSKLCEADFEENKAAILSQACHHDFLDQLSKHVALIPLEMNRKRKENVGIFLDDLMTFLENVINLLPSKAVEGFEKIFTVTDMMIQLPEVQQSASASCGELNKRFEHLKAKYKTCTEEHVKKGIEENINTYTLEVPDDFREINIFPDAEDILAKEPGFVRPNIISGAYESIDDYLDTQFRLLREDFVSPLREGISEYINLADKRRIRNISSVRIYHKVFFLNPKVIKDRLGLVVCFDPNKHFTKVVWEQSKRFMFGSLLLFSRDNFANIIFATVLDRRIEDLKAGKIVVQLSECSDVPDDLISKEFVMAESQVYFEPYYHVLKALQNLTKTSFPMQKYIIHAQMSGDPPKYMCSESGVLLDIDGWSVQVLEDDSWPGAQQLKLDISQYNAFKLALTKEFVVIQGPPGTGKTFLGLKVATVLLKNAPVWNASKKPLLVVCYTNHALDQFLEGLVPVTDRIVRVGGQSKSEVLQAFNLKENRRMRRGRRNLIDLKRDLHHRMSGIMNSIKSIQNDVDMIANNQGIISLSVLKEVHIIRDQHASCFASHDKRVSETLFCEWLEYGMYDDPPPCEAEGNQNHNQGHNIDGSDDGEAEEMHVDMEDMQCHMIDDLMDWELDVGVLGSRLTFALDLNRIEEEIQWHEFQIQDLKNQIKVDQSVVHTLHLQEDICRYLKLKMNYIKSKLHQDGRQNRRTLEHLLQQVNLWQLWAEERWTLYRYWVERYRNILFEELHKLEKHFRSEARMYEEVQQMNDLEILRDSLVVGMTTTGAAKLQPLLQALKPRIVIVEEAAEILESHIVVSLTRHCEHLILIGDHQQLRPSTAAFQLAHDFNFDISLFERMLKNKMHCETLKVQHRMRPEVAELIVPAIYPELVNHNSVMQYEKVRGMLKSVFFITHNHAEEEVADICSHRNTHEGDFLIALCRYLVLQGYSSSRITILATYSGQMFYLRSVRKKHKMLSEVRITVVDNFQGEENDIILLSLVRSNKEARIGFLKIENRVCVALSRAKMGLYIIGNMENLTRSSTVWQKIEDTLKKQEALGAHLTLRCQVHPTMFTPVRTAADFDNVPEGGCLQRCASELPCGHTCERVCHIHNREHINMLCMEPCERIPEQCKLQHKCRKLCWQDCGSCKTPVQRKLQCEHSLNLECYIDPEKFKCSVKVEVKLPDCEHTMMKPCYMDCSLVICSHPCEDRLPCGHSCEFRCHIKNDPDHLEYQCRKQCTRKNANCKEEHKCKKMCYEECGDCMVQVTKKLPHCEHTANMPCSMDPEKYLCKGKCSKMLPCGHPCPNKCYEECGNCQVKVTKRVDGCEHPLEVKCCEKPDPKLCKSPCKKSLPCGHKCTTVCSRLCTQKCLESIPSKVRPVCGHLVYIPCYMQREILNPESEELLSRCQMPCGAILRCEHKCAGTCGECMQGRIHMTCKEKCGKTLICGHSCNIPCAESCPPCSRKCNYRCKHSRCSRPCGQPCIKCKEPCEFACIHHRCKKFCFELCDREPCNVPCDKLLPCQHPCIGFCGEPCPPLCRICDKDRVTEVFFGTEDEPDARFVYLEDCKHVLEATGLEQWVAQTDNEIKPKVCPQCKTPIVTTQRFMNIIKQMYQRVCQVKSRVFGNIRAIEASRDDLRTKLLRVRRHDNFMSGSKTFRVLRDKLSTELQPVLWNKRNILSATATGTLRIQIEIFSQLVECCSNAHIYLDKESRDEIFTYMDMLFRVVMKRGKKISEQEVEEINMEIQRFHRLCQLHKMKSEETYIMNRSNPEVKKQYEVAHRLAYCKEKFTEEHDKELKNALENLSKVIKSAVRITDAEKRQIVQAMGYKQGHWYACPNGHIYIITECGGAMETGRCNECGEEIGGGSHRLLPSNRVATEMDGATRPAWPQPQLF